MNIEWLEKIPPSFVMKAAVVLVAAAGSVARYLERWIEGEPFLWTKFAAHFLVSTFTGFTFAQFGEFLHMGINGVILLACIGSFTGPRSVDFIYSLIQKRLGQ